MRAKSWDEFVTLPELQRAHAAQRDLNLRLSVPVYVESNDPNNDNRKSRLLAPNHLRAELSVKQPFSEMDLTRLAFYLPDPL